jgi:hypothetical protein
MFHMSGKSPFQLNYNLLPTGSLPKSLVPDLKEILLNNAMNIDDRVDLREQWSHTEAETKLDKLVLCLKALLERNQRQYRIFDQNLHSHLQMPLEGSNFSIRAEARHDIFLKRLRKMIDLYYIKTFDAPVQETKKRFRKMAQPK